MKVTKLKKEKKENAKSAFKKQQEHSKVVKSIMKKRRSIEPEKSI